jgi:hypothetical protein
MKALSKELSENVAKICSLRKKKKNEWHNPHDEECASNLHFAL